MHPAAAAVLLLAAYLLGAIPFSNLVARWRRGVDLRGFGSGTVSGTGLYRVAGLPALVAAGVLDVAKGAAGPLLAGGAEQPLLAVAAGVATVAGHNWSVFLRFAGGRGLSPAMGALLVLAWPGAALLLAGLALGRAFGETALGAFVAIATLPLVLTMTAGATAAWAGFAFAALLLGKRVAGNAPAPHPRMPTYLTRLLHDRDER
jgi:acyl phosphate:glycerol-3-phosphate acyltransferase